MDIQRLNLAGTIARHPMHKLGGFFAKPRPFLPGDFVTTDQGTGLVHMAPDHGEDDFELCKRMASTRSSRSMRGGMYRADWLWLGGQGSVINAKFNAPDGPIYSDLREAGALLAASADFKHSYPHSVAVEGEGHLPLYAAMVHRDGPAAHPLPSERRAEKRWEGEGGARHGRRGLRRRGFASCALQAIADTRSSRKGGNRLARWSRAGPTG